MEYLHSLLDAYPVFDKDKLRNELKTLWGSEDLPKDPTSLLRFLHDSGLDEPLDQLTKLLKLQMTLPVSTASTERSFSCLKRVKTYLRNTMGQERLDGLAKISIENELVSSMQKEQLYEKVINEFTKLKDRRIDLLYK